MGKTDKFVQLVKGAGIAPKVIFDIGAFDGAETMELAAAFPEAEVYAFECVPKNAARCAERLAGNPLVHLVPVALGDRSGLLWFNESTSANEECGSLLKPNGRYFEPMPIRKTIVPCYSIHTLCRWNDFPIPDVIWMDVQGYELKVLGGMQEHISFLQMFWAEVAYSAYYEGQMLVEEFDAEVKKLGFSKIYEETGIPNWFGNVCYKRDHV